MSLVPFLHRAAAGENLTSDQAHQAMSVLLEGRATEAAIAGFLVALRMKGETASELAGFARAMREKSVFVDAGPDVIDIVGTGGDSAGTFNISTVAAIIIAGAGAGKAGAADTGTGARVAKHGNRAISGRVGSADVLEALGVRIALTPEESVRAIREIGLGFLFAPHLHPAMKYAQSVRRELKMRTVFNLLGPLANPARAQYQVIGAPSSEAAQIMAEASSQRICTASTIRSLPPRPRARARAWGFRSATGLFRNTAAPSKCRIAGRAAPVSESIFRSPAGRRPAGRL